MSDILFNGYTPTTERLCLRCRRTFKSCLYQTCDECRGEDEKDNEASITCKNSGSVDVIVDSDIHGLGVLDVDIDAADEHDHQDEVHNARYGF
jgi:hypothetical protein